MNNYNGVSERRRNEDVKLLLSGLKFTADRYALKLKLMPPKTKKCIVFSVLFVLCIYFHQYPISWLFPDTVTAYESLLDTSKCPACFGSRVCGLFYYGQVKMSGSSKFRLLDYFNIKNVYYAQLAQGNVVVKKMATNNELIGVDSDICLDANKPEGCDVSRAFPVTSWAIPFNNKPMTLDTLKDTQKMLFSCPSQRLLDSIWTHFQEYDIKNEVTASDKLKVLYTSLVNPEPLILQTFPKSEGWPFPQYFGACGRAIVLENYGESLGSFYHAEFHVRVVLAYELMMIADTLTSKFDYGLYLTDVSFENFAIDYSGKVAVVDLEHIIVVDKLDVKARAPKDWNVPHQTKFTYCHDGGNCLAVKAEDLCNHELSDHNYYTICRFILSQYSDDPKYPGGLLHSMPKEASDLWSLEYHLNACANPRPPADRYKAKDDVIQALKGLKDAAEDSETLFKNLEKKR